MSTSFYLGKEDNKKMFQIARTHAGWKPLFKSFSTVITSTYDIFMYMVGEKLNIYDEHGSQYRWIEFEQRVLYHCPDGKSHIE